MARRDAVGGVMGPQGGVTLERWGTWVKSGKSNALGEQPDSDRERRESFDIHGREQE